MALYIPAAQRSPEMKKWIDEQLDRAPKRDEQWAADLYRIYGYKCKQKGHPG